jgi:peptidoglycan L-alanyl-D-glutamate endopeptidase CwlK
MSFRLSERSLRRLTGVHPRLVALVREAAALSPVEFMVTEGLRTPERQAALVRARSGRVT